MRALLLLLLLASPVLAQPPTPSPGDTMPVEIPEDPDSSVPS